MFNFSEIWLIQHRTHGVLREVVSSFSCKDFRKTSWVYFFLQMWHRWDSTHVPFPLIETCIIEDSTEGRHANHYTIELASSNIGSDFIYLK